MSAFGGIDPATGKQVMPTGSADTQAAAIELRDRFRAQVRERTAVRTGVTLSYSSTSGWPVTRCDVLRCTDHGRF